MGGRKQNIHQALMLRLSLTLLFPDTVSFKKEKENQPNTQQLKKSLLPCAEISPDSVLVLELGSVCDQGDKLVFVSICVVTRVCCKVSFMFHVRTLRCQHWANSQWQKDFASLTCHFC